MAEAVDGFVADRVLLDWHGPGGGPEHSTAQAVGARLHKQRMLTAGELPLLAALGAVPFKITLPAPSNFAVAGFKRGLTDAAYANARELLVDLAAIIGDEIRWLIASGVRYIQLDAPFYSHYLDPRHRAGITAAGGDPDAEVELAIAGDNAALRAADHTGTIMAVHVCRGNSRSRWYTEGGYDAIAEKLFASLEVDRFLLEYDTARAGGFEPLRLVPPGKDVVLGLVTTKEGTLEREDDIARRIDDAARLIPLERLALSPQCGFASVAAGNLLTMDDQWRKLDLVARTARMVWG
jgi:5-methyltetrahydropteroyltriglutamate--homocysteine methyltransferase